MKKTEIAKNLLLGHTCDNCFFKSRGEVFGLECYERAILIRKRENVCKGLRFRHLIMNYRAFPKKRICIHWQNI